MHLPSGALLSLCAVCVAQVWLLLSRHTTFKEQGRDDYLTVHLFKERGGHRVYFLENVWSR